MRSKTKWFVILALVLGAAGFSILMTGDRDGKAPSPAARASNQAIGKDEKRDGPPAFAMAVEVAPVSVGTITLDVGAVGTLEANESVIIRPEIPGRVTKIGFEEGQQVKNGTVLIELDSAELQAQLAQAEAELEIAELNYERTKQLIANDNVSRQELDQASSSLKSAKANHALFKERLSKTRIRAPFSGYLGTRRVSPGDYVQAGRDMVNLEDIKTLKIDFRIPEIYLSRLAVGQTVDVQVDAFPGQTFTGEVYVLDPRVDETSRTVRARARIPNLNFTLRPGLFANVKVVLGQTEQAMLIPEEAVVPQQGKTFVFLVKDNKAHLTEVELGLRKRAVVQVLKGVTPGDVVVRAGQQKIRDGMPIRPIEG